MHGCTIHLLVSGALASASSSSQPGAVTKQKKRELRTVLASLLSVHHDYEQLHDRLSLYRRRAGVTWHGVTIVTRSSESHISQGIVPDLYVLKPSPHRGVHALASATTRLCARP